MTMLRYLGLMALPLLLLATPAAALTAKQKMETCKIGAQSQKLTGAKRTAFIKRCMAKDTSKKPMAKKPAAHRVATAPHRLTRKEKMKTCEIGATVEKLTGAKRNAFIKRCMARGDYEPPARRALKRHAMKKPAMKKPMKKSEQPMKKPEQKKQ
jgi:psiF repeat